MKRGVLLGVATSLLAVLLPTAWAVWVNPWFLDEFGVYALVILLPAVVLGSLAGLLLGRLAELGGLVLRVGQVLLLSDLALLLFVAFSSPPVAAHSPRLVVFGIDGASWEIVDELAAEERLPTLHRLAGEGHRASLLGDEPLFSPLLWTTMATGQPPDVHGIRGFRTRSDQARVPRFWDIAVDAGLSIGLYKWLVTWPPESFPSGGFVVPAWLAPTPETQPTELSFVKEIELSRRLKRKRIQPVRPGWRLALAGIPQGLRFSTLLEATEWTVRERLTRPVEEERAWRLQLLRVWMDRDVLVAQVARKELDVVTFTTYAPDALGHTHWAARESCRDGSECLPWAHAVDEAYEQADAVLAELVEVARPEHLLVVSDHGFRAMGEDDAGRYFAPKTERLKARLEASVGRVDVARVGHKLAVTLLDEDAGGQKEAVIDELSSWTQASTGEPLYRWEDIPGTGVALGLTFRDERIDADRLASDQVGGEPLDDYARLTEAYSGEHAADGIWLYVGPEVEPGQPNLALPRYRQLDVAPTLLALLGIPSSEEMPGRVRHGEVLERVESWQHLAPESKGEVGDDDVNTELLEQLGYIER